MLTRFYPEDFANPSLYPNKNLLGDGQIDATAALEAALAGLKTAGKGIFDLSRGLYRVSRGLTLPDGDNVAVEGSGPSSGLILRGPFSANPWPYILVSNDQGGYGLGSPSTLTAWASAGDTVIKVANGSLFPVGSTLRIYFTTTSGSGTTIGRYQHNEVIAVDPDGVTLHLAVAIAFDSPAGVGVNQTRLRRGLRVGNLGLYSAEATGKNDGLVFVWERDALVENISTDGQGLYVPDQSTGAGIIFSDGYRNRLNQATVSRDGSNGENAIAVRLQTAFQGSNITTNAGIFGLGITGTTDSQFSNLSSDRAWGRGIKLSGSYYNQISNVRVTNARHTGLGFSGGSSDNMVNGVDIRGINSPGGQNQGIWFNGESNRRNTITMATVLNTPGGSLVIPATDDTNVVQFVRRPDTVPYVASADSVVSYLKP